jgi:large subunit ribosomal protein L10
MKKSEKHAQVAELKEVMEANNFIYVADTSSLSANDTNKLRRELFNNGVKMRVAKNTLINLAMQESSKEFGELTSILKGTSAILVSENQKSPAIAIKKFRAKSDRPVLKGAYIDSAIFIGDNQLEALTQLKSKEDLIGEVITLLQSPAKNVISGLKSSSSKLAGILQTLSEKEN